MNRPITLDAGWLFVAAPCVLFTLAMAWVWIVLPVVQRVTDKMTRAA